MKVSAGKPVVGRPMLSLRKPRPAEIANELEVLGRELIEAAEDLEGQTSDQLRAVIKGYGVNVINASRRVRILAD